MKNEYTLICTFWTTIVFVLFFLHLHFSYCFLSHFRCWRKNICHGSLIQNWDGGRSRRTRRSEIRQRSTGAPVGTNLPNVLVKPKIFITHLHVVPSQTFVHLWNINAELFNEIWEIIFFIYKITHSREHHDALVLSWRESWQSHGTFVKICWGYIISEYIFYFFILFFCCCCCFLYTRHLLKNLNLCSAQKGLMGLEQHEGK